MSRIADTRFSEAFEGKNVIIVGVVNKELTRQTIEGYGGKTVKSFKDADTLIVGDFPKDWHKRKCKFGATVNPLDAIDYVEDGKCSITHDNILIADHWGFCLC